MDTTIASRPPPSVIANHARKRGDIAETPKSASAEPPQAASDGYPSAFDQDVMRWVPVVIPLLGVAMVLLTGLMWTMA